MIIIADNLNVMQTDFARALASLDSEPVRAKVRECLQRGTQGLDINPGPLRKRPEACMTFLVETVQAMTDLPLLLDTTNAAAMAAGLRACRSRAIINGFSLEPVKLDHILPLAQQFDADLIGYLLHPDSQVPIDETEMMQVAVALFKAFTDAGLNPARLIIDPVVAPLSWQEGARHNRAVLKVIDTLPDLLGISVRTIAGISNLTSGPMPVARKIALEQTFLPMLAAAGLDMALINVRHTATVETARICTGLLGEQVFAWTARGQDPNGPGR
jgi:5-methyltetrahydrofolate corrinoid/iron sulfur protein methyltransferase